MKQTFSKRNRKKLKPPSSQTNRPEKIREKLLSLSSGGQTDFRNFLEASATTLPEQKRRNEFGLVLLRALMDKGYTQASFAEKIGKSRQQINSIIKGKENLTIDTIQQLETGLGMRLQHFHAQEIPEINTAIASNSVLVSFKMALMAVHSTLFDSQPVGSRQFQMSITRGGAARSDNAGYKDLAAAAYRVSAQC